MLYKDRLETLYAFQYGIGNVNPNNGGQYPVYGSNGIIGYYDKYNSEDSPVVGHIGANAGIVVFGKGKHYVTYNGVICKAKSGVNSRYAYYTLLNANPKKLTRGSTQPFISYDILNAIPILKHEFKDQIKIGNILAALDDKIELNNKVNQELEKTAKDLYNYWFVQFDFPDGNKRPYKSSGGKMVYNDVLKREIPEGWTMDTLGNICNLYQPETISEKDCDPNGKYYVYGSNGIIGRYNKKNHNDSEIVISCRGDCGNIIRTMPNVWITGNAMVVHPKSNVSQEFIYFALQNAGIKRIITGSVQGQITRKNLEPVKIVMPPLSLLEQYEQLVCDNVNTRIQNDIETELLQKLRDFLLPMLMNGQVSVSD